MTPPPSELPRELPGDVREQDAALDVAALDGLRARIGKNLNDTQGAWAQKPSWQRALPLVLGVLASAAWAAHCLDPDGAKAVNVAAAIAALSSIGAYVAVGRAPLHPAWGERMARISLAAGCLALACEIGFAWFAPPTDGATDMQCARAIILGALVPSLLLAWYVRSSQSPARLFHVVAVAGAAFLSSSAAVWAECPGTKPDHILGAHIAAPLVIAIVVVAVLRPMLRGARISLT